MATPMAGVGPTSLFGLGDLRLFDAVGSPLHETRPMHELPDNGRRTECELPNCGALATEIVTHPQRGGLAVCHRHARNIRAIPADRFPGGAINS